MKNQKFQQTPTLGQRESIGFNLRTDIDVTYTMANVEEKYAYYLKFIDHDPTDIIPNQAIVDAICEGYFAAFHCKHAYAPDLFVPASKLAQHIDCKFNCYESELVTNDPKLCSNYQLLVHSELNSGFRHELKIAFVTGYRLACHLMHKDDDCFRLSGSELYQYVGAKLNSYNRKQIDARRAEARIIATRYGLSKTELATLIGEPQS